MLKGTILSFVGEKAGSAIRTKPEYAKTAARKNKKCPKKTKTLWKQQKVPPRQTIVPSIPSERKPRIRSYY